MKTQAKNLKIGMTVIEGGWSNKIESIEKGFQKNGVPIITITGKDNNTRKNIYGKQRIESLQSRVYKELTFVNIL
jgi:CO dehydrogenase/acetyl-CoA synthase alpha subunit